MKQMKWLILIVLLVILVIQGCASHTHFIGKGAKEQVTEQKSETQRQWYILFGLVPLNKVDTHVMAAGTSDYTIKTEQGPLDILIEIGLNMLLFPTTIHTRTVTVTK
ncbi:MAG: hypothetical protein QME51_07815 [Planctomycetota bacterium]|nr:hypothetical protein [Planctomycetota bacterium]